MRVGIGYDIHPFEPGRPLVLGGIRIPDEPGLSGHSDADVLTHAVIDALLGAAALGDIGRRFPSDDPQYRDANSLDLLRQTVRMLAEAGHGIQNLDCTVIAERPRVAPHAEAMRSALAEALGVEVASVSVKATTANGLGAIGRGEGIAALAIALLDST
ncbi:MAG: 2-C-methyl-D-erythritol 2,4-cyclodiphosphate synthase [Dehalococcoidia bacterium]|nr:2-C-methyl-D-erythritol 2,4-cyclodiphosphate synthase [Dehalococcoidia bacterium]